MTSLGDAPTRPYPYPFARAVQYFIPKTRNEECQGAECVEVEARRSAELADTDARQSTGLDVRQWWGGSCSGREGMCGDP
eukprot:1736374-Rhodomonas_salina.2